MTVFFVCLIRWEDDIIFILNWHTKENLLLPSNGGNSPLQNWHESPLSKYQTIHIFSDM